MGYIYKITNILNNKTYIGQTITTVKQRIDKHIARSKTDKATGIDGAIKLYGIDNFTIETIEECADDKLDEQEQFWINHYHSYVNDPLGNGYNLTIGGQKSTTTIFIDIDELKKIYQQFGTVKDTAIYFKCSEKTISQRLKANNVTVKKHHNTKDNIKHLENLQKGKKFELGHGVKSVHIDELDLDFPSLKECSQWLIDNGYSRAKNMKMARKSLSWALNKGQGKYCNLHFKYN